MRDCRQKPSTCVFVEETIFEMDEDVLPEIVYIPKMPVVTYPKVKPTTLPRVRSVCNMTQHRVIYGFDLK